MLALRSAKIAVTVSIIAVVRLNPAGTTPHAGPHSQKDFVPLPESESG
jgi:hypothetical protein